MNLFAVSAVLQIPEVDIDKYQSTVNKSAKLTAPVTHFINRETLLQSDFRMVHGAG